jgi:hypothetical protein
MRAATAEARTTRKRVQKNHSSKKTSGGLKTNRYKCESDTSGIIRQEVSLVKITGKPSSASSRKANR